MTSSGRFTQTVHYRVTACRTAVGITAHAATSHEHPQCSTKRTVSATNKHCTASKL